MSENTEQVEAKLAAYIDGELNPAERAEIEAYLNSNPEHRAVIEDLLRQRSLLGNLPRESAPAEIAEHFQNQLERSELLAGSDVVAPSMRINRAPQFMALAAMVLLTVGLAIVVYMVLFATRPPTFTIAPTKPAPTSDEVAMAVVAPPTTPSDTPSVPAGNTSPPEVMTKSGAGTVVATASPAPQQPGAGAIGGGEVETQNKPTQAQNSLFANGDRSAGAQGQSQASPPETLVVNVATDNPLKTQDQLATYFKSRNITWENAPEPMPEPLMLKNSQVLEGARFNQTKVQVAGKMGAESKLDEQKQEAPTTENAKDQLAQVAVADQERVKEKQGLVAKRLASEPSQADKNNFQMVVAAPSQAPTTLASSVGQNRIYARGLTRRQAIELASTLNSRVGQSAQILNDSNIEVQDLAKLPPPTTSTALDTTLLSVTRERQATTSSSTAPLLAARAAPRSEAAPATTSATTKSTDILARAGEIHPGDALLLSAGDLGSPDNAGIMRVNVNADGTITLPALGRVAAADQTPEQLQESIGKLLKEAKMGDRSGVMVRKLPATNATSQPTQEEKVDVVVVLQNELAPPPVSAPSAPVPAATNPASKPTTAP